MKFRSEQITELNTKVDDLKKQVHLFKNKNSVLLNSPAVFASEKKKYLDSVINILEKEIKFERFRNPYLDRTDNQKLISEMEKITQKISQENTIPFAAFNEIFKDNEMVNQLFSLLRFGNNNEAEDIPIGKQKKRKKL